MLLLAAALTVLSACGTLDIRLEYPPTAERVSTEAPKAAAPAMKPMTPTAVPAGLSPYAAEPALQPMPVEEYPVPDRLRIAYLQDGDAWLWSAAQRQAAPLTTGGDIDGPFQISDDGGIVAFARGGELWMVRSDGTDERPLLGASDLDGMAGQGSELRFSQFDWAPGTHLLAFNTRRYQAGAWVPNHDLYLADADTLALTQLLPPDKGGEFHYSPDGTMIAVVTEGAISLVDADGENRKEAVLTYTPVNPGGIDHFYAQPTWSADSSSLMVAIPAPVAWDTGMGETQDGSTASALASQPTTIWHLTADGGPASLVGKINTIPTIDPRSVSFSSDLVFAAYAELKEGESTTLGQPDVWLVINRLGAIDRQAYPELDSFYGWAPGGREFAFSAGQVESQLVIGQWSGPTGYSGVLEGASVEDLRWVNADNYLFVVRHHQEAGAEGDSWNLMLGNVEGASTKLSSAQNYIGFDFANPGSGASR